jgi:hypothetical protein
MADACMQYKTIPQFSHTCWFNGILHVLLYSKLLRKTIYNHLVSSPDFSAKVRKDSFLFFIYYILHNYKKLDNLQTIYKHLDDGDIKSDRILLSYLRRYDLETFDYYKKQLLQDFFNFRGYYTYIYHIFKTYGINYVDLTYNKTTGSMYIQTINRLQLKEKESESRNYFSEKIANSDIICINHNVQGLYNTSEDENLDRYRSSIKDYDSFVASVRGFSKKLTLYGNEYTLDSCLLVNYGVPEHVISGVMCKDNYYVYDSYDNYQSVKSKPYKKVISRIVCPPYKHNWADPNVAFTLNVNKCDGHTASAGTPVDPGYAAYNIATSYVMLIYVKSKDSTGTSIIKSRSSTADTTTSIGAFVINKKNYLRGFKELYDLESLPLDNLINHIRNIYNTAYDNKGDSLIFLSTSMKDHFRFLYEKLLKKTLDPSVDNNVLRRELFIALINRFIKNGTVFKYELFVDQTFLNNMKELNIKPILTLPSDQHYPFAFYKIGLSDDSKAEYRNYILANVDFIYNYLFNTQPFTRWYNDYIKWAVSTTIGENKFYCIIVRFIIDITIFKYKIETMLTDIYNYQRQTQARGGMRKLKKY